MQSEVNQEENLNRIITVPNLLSFFSALSDSGNYMELLCKEKSSNECREVTEKYRTGRSAYLRLGQLFMRLFAGLL